MNVVSDEHHLSAEFGSVGEISELQLSAVRCSMSRLRFLIVFFSSTSLEVGCQECSHTYKKHI